MKTKAAAWKRTVNKILSKASMTPDLRNAVRELRTAITRKQWDKASELSTVKSFITGSLEMPKKYHFREDSKYNEKVLGGRDVYSLLDGINFDISMMTGDMPAGMMLVSAEGVKGREPKYFKSPTLALIERERKDIQRKVKKLDKVI
jgi:hypothetical protein